MARWIRADDDASVNLDHVTKATLFTRTRGDSKRYHIRLDMVGGETAYSSGSSSPPDMDELFCEVIPAQPGQEAIIAICDTSGDRPKEADVTMDRYPIIGWRITTCEYSEYNYPTPITPSVSSGTVLIVLPDGRLLDQDYECEYDSIDSARAEVLERAQSRWDWREKRKQDEEKVEAS